MGRHEARLNAAPELDELLEQFRERHWTLYRFGDSKEPEIIANAYAWRVATDIVIIRDEFDASAFRVPHHGNSDYFMPRTVWWQWHGEPVPTLTAMFHLPPPQEPQAPEEVQVPHFKCLIYKEQRGTVNGRAVGTGQSRWAWFENRRNGTQ